MANRHEQLKVARDLVQRIGYVKVLHGIQEIYNNATCEETERHCNWIVGKLSVDYVREHGHLPSWFELR